MNIDREKLLSNLEAHISRSAQLMHQAATADHATLRDNSEIWLESMETDVRLLRRLLEDCGLVAKSGNDT